jgi:adenine-specific DNA-methyltransferase
MGKKQQITYDIKVPNNDLDNLRKHFPHCFDKEGVFQLAKFEQNLTDKEINFSRESYGLDWLGKSYARLLASDAATTLLKENETHNQKAENLRSENLLIKGDNLEVLKHLASAYHEKVKMIYIDPPYNTGSDGFVYADDRKFTARELQQLAGIDEERAKRILDFTKSKSNSHSAWLTFMYPRLYIAKQLLKDDGVIFISIDDNEVAQLRLLMDEVYGEENFVACVVWQKKYAATNDVTGFSTTHDYIVIYQKSESFYRNLLPRTEKTNKPYKNDDNDGMGLWRSGDLLVKSYSPSGVYPIINPNTKESFLPAGGSSWRASKETMDKWLTENRIYFGKDGKGAPQLKRYLSEVQQGVVPITWWTFDEVGHNDEASKEVSELFECKTPFDTPKPARLIKQILRISSNPSDLILDFFAGSGTTGDAVMQLNAEDGGSRKYILVQLPEEIDPKKNKVAYDFVKDELHAEPTIFEITKERLIRSANKTREAIAAKVIANEKEIKAYHGKLDIADKDTKVKQLKMEIQALQEQDLGFKIFETMPIWDDYEYEADEFNVQAELFDESKLTADDIKSLLTTWKTNDGIALTQGLVTIDLSGYQAYYGQGKLYLMDKGFTTDSLIKLLEKIDADKAFSPAVVIAFGHHFESKSLLELAESLKSYANKKKIDIDFITRY